MQERRNSIANALDLRFFCTDPSKCDGDDENCLMLYKFMQVNGQPASAPLSLFDGKIVITGHYSFSTGTDDPNSAVAIDMLHKSHKASLIYHIALFCNRNGRMCAHFSYKMVHCTKALWDLWYGSVEFGLGWEEIKQISSIPLFSQFLRIFIKLLAFSFSAMVTPAKYERALKNFVSHFTIS